MAAPGPLVAWFGGETSCCTRLSASSRGRLGAVLGVMSVVRWRSGGTGGPPSLRAGWWALGRTGLDAGFPCTSADVRGVLSLSRERTKGRPVEANPRQQHGCPRTPRRLACERNLLLREANCFLAGAACSGFRCYVSCPLAAGRHRWAALVARGVVSLSGVSRLVGWLGGTGQEWCGSPHWYMAGGAGVTSVGLRRRSPPLSTKAEGATLTRSGATVGEPRPSANNPVPSPEGKVSRRKP